MERDHHPVAEANQEIDVDDAPDQPRDEAAKMDPAEVDDSGLAPNGSKIAGRREEYCNAVHMSPGLDATPLPPGAQSYSVYVAGINGARYAENALGSASRA